MQARYAGSTSALAGALYGTAPERKQRPWRLGEGISGTLRLQDARGSSNDAVFCGAAAVDLAACKTLANPPSQVNSLNFLSQPSCASSRSALLHGRVLGVEVLEVVLRCCETRRAQAAQLLRDAALLERILARLAITRQQYSRQ